MYFFSVSKTVCISKHFIFTLTVLSTFAFHLLYSSLVTLKAKLFMESAVLFSCCSFWNKPEFRLYTLSANEVSSLYDKLTVAHIFERETGLRFWGASVVCSSLMNMCNILFDAGFIKSCVTQINRSVLSSSCSISPLWSSLSLRFAFFNCELHVKRCKV